MAAATLLCGLLWAVQACCSFCRFMLNSICQLEGRHLLSAAHSIRHLPEGTSCPRSLRWLRLCTPCSWWACRALANAPHTRCRGGRSSVWPLLVHWPRTLRWGTTDDRKHQDGCHHCRSRLSTTLPKRSMAHPESNPKETMALLWGKQALIILQCQLEPGPGFALPVLPTHGAAYLQMHAEPTCPHK